jgi:hypothetical protein
MNFDLLALVAQWEDWLDRLRELSSRYADGADELANEMDDIADAIELHVMRLKVIGQDAP